MSNFASELRMHEVMRSLMRHMIEPLDEVEFYQPLAGGGNSPGWILGHLTVVHRLGGALLGGPSVAPEELSLFGPGSSGVVEAAKSPAKAELLLAEAAADRELLAAVQRAPEDLLNSPQQTPFLQQEFPLVRDLVAHILVSHLSLHVGQLSAWRRAKGLPSILQI